MNQVPRVNTQTDYGRNSSKRIGDTVDSLPTAQEQNSTNIKKKRRTQTKHMECKADLIWASNEFLILGNQRWKVLPQSQATHSLAEKAEELPTDYYYVQPNSKTRRQAFSVQISTNEEHQEQRSEA